MSSSNETVEYPYFFYRGEKSSNEESNIYCFYYYIPTEYENIIHSLTFDENIEHYFTSELSESEENKLLFTRLNNSFLVIKQNADEVFAKATISYVTEPVRTVEVHFMMIHPHMEDYPVLGLTWCAPINRNIFNEGTLVGHWHMNNADNEKLRLIFQTAMKLELTKCEISSSSNYHMYSQVGLFIFHALASLLNMKYLEICAKIKGNDKYMK